MATAWRHAERHNAPEVILEDVFQAVITAERNRAIRIVRKVGDYRVIGKYLEEIIGRLR